MTNNTNPPQGVIELRQAIVALYKHFVGRYSPADEEVDKLIARYAPQSPEPVERSKRGLQTGGGSWEVLREEYDGDGICRVTAILGTDENRDLWVALRRGSCDYIPVCLASTVYDRMHGRCCPCRGLPENSQICLLNQPSEPNIEVRELVEAATKAVKEINFCAPLNARLILKAALAKFPKVKP